MQVKATCGICQGNCKVVLTVEDGKIIKVEPDRESPRGRACFRGVHAPDILYGEQRLKKPLIRVGEKGEGKFREASWEEALDFTAQKLKAVQETYGARALASYFGRGVLRLPVTRMGTAAKTPFFAHLGSPNDMCTASICNIASSTVTPITVLGMYTYQMVQDVEHSDYIIAWGKNSFTDDGPQLMLQRIKAAQKRGAKLIVIDPRRTGLGEIADQWIPITPGSDGALALAMLKLIVENGRYDHDFVRDYTRGFDPFAEYLSSLSLDQLSDWCGIPTKQIAELTDLFCSTPKISLVSYTGLEYQLSAIQNSRAIFILWAITGKLDVKGGIYLNAEKVPTFQLKDIPEDNLAIGVKEFPMFYRFMGAGQFSCFPKAVLQDDPYPVRSLLLIGGSPILSYPDSNTWREAYKKLDCLIVLERNLTEDCRYADVVFPSCTMYECPMLVSTPNGPQIQQPVIAPVGEARNDVLTLSALAKRLGFGEEYPQTEEEFCSWLQQGSIPTTVHLGSKIKKERKYEKCKTGDLRADGQPGFPTPSGKLEICSVYLEQNGYSPYPVYSDIRSIPQLNRPDLPFTLTSGARSNFRMGVIGANHPFVAAVEPYPLMDISPEDAKELGIQDGEMALVTTPFGSGKYKAKICGMARHAIHIPHGGGSSYMTKPWKEGNVNDLCSLEYHDPITGFVTIKSVPCRVEKIQDKTNL